MTTPVEIETEPSTTWLKISLESAFSILSRSYGEIRTPRLFDSKLDRFHNEGLFSETIFGPAADHACACGKLSGLENFGRVCEECGVQIRSNSVRGQRLAHISLPVPILHPWFWGHDLATVELLLEMSHQQLRGLLSRKRFIQLGGAKPQFCPTSRAPSIAQSGFEPTLDELLNRSGSNAVKWVLDYVNPLTLLIELENNPDSLRKGTRASKRFELLQSVIGENLVPANMVLESIPVLPAWQRTIRLAADGGIEVDPVTARYQRIIRWCQAVERCIARLRSRDDKWPDRQSICRLAWRERRLAVEVAGLFSELLRRRPAPLLEAEDRAVVVPDPSLPLYACRLPEKRAEKLATADEIWKAPIWNTARRRRLLESEVAKRPLVLNLAEPGTPSELVALHPRLTTDRAIHVHPLLANMFQRSTADLHASVHALSWLESELDCDRLSVPAVGLRDPIFGNCRHFPASDAAVGCYYATWLAADSRKLRDQAIAGELESRAQIPTFAGLDDVCVAWHNGRLQLRDLVGIRLLPYQKLIRDIRDPVDLRDGKLRAGTTVGRALMNSFLPSEFPYYDVPFDLTALKTIVRELLDAYGDQAAEKFVERATAFGLHVLTRSGLSLSQADLLPPPSTTHLIDETRREIARLHRLEARGIICPSEQWSNIFDKVAAARDKSKSAHVEAIQDSGANLHPLMAVLMGTGKLWNDEVRSPIGIIGSVWTPWALRMPTPILGNVNQGVRSHQYFQLAASSRQWQVNALRNPAAPRRLLHRIAGAIGDVVISEEDCGTLEGIVLERWPQIDRENPPPAFSGRLAGRVAVHALVSFGEEGFSISANTVITPVIAKGIDRAAINEVKVRSPLYCRARKGICRKCFGADSATGSLIEVGEAVGIKAALTIGPTLRAVYDLQRPPPVDATFREFMDADRGFAAARQDGVVSLRRLRVAIDRAGQRVVVSPGGVIELISNNAVVDTAWVAHGALVNVAAGAQVSTNDNLATWDVERQRVLAQDSGTVRLRHRGVEKLGYQLLTIQNAAGATVDGCILPADATLHVRDSDRIEIGDLLAEYERRDRSEPEYPAKHFQQLERLLTLEPPAERALIAESEGRVELCVADDGLQCEIRIQPLSPGEPTSYRLPAEQIPNLIARTGQVVSPGEPLTQGKLSLADVVRTRGAPFVQSCLLATINRILADLKRDRPVDERPWELIVAQMLRFVRIESRGDTALQSGAVLRRSEVMATNDALADQVKIPDVNAYPVPLQSNLVSREVYLDAEQQRRIVDPQSPPPGVSIPWPAGWSAMLMGIDELARHESLFTTDGSQLDRDSLVRAVISGRWSRLDRIQESVLAGSLMPAGSGWNRNDS